MKKRKNLGNYDENRIFWKDFIDIPENPYKLETNMGSFNCLFGLPLKWLYNHKGNRHDMNRPLEIKK